MPHIVAHEFLKLQHQVARRARTYATVCSMVIWQEWRNRAKVWKENNDLTDEAIAAAVGRARGTINSWLNHREPNLSDFMALCAAMGADPGLILFGQKVLHNAVAKSSDAQRVLNSEPTGDPHHKDFITKLKKVQKFKQRRRTLRKVIVR